MVFVKWHTATTLPGQGPILVRSEYKCTTPHCSCTIDFHVLLCTSLSIPTSTQARQYRLSCRRAAGTFSGAAANMTNITPSTLQPHASRTCMYHVCAYVTGSGSPTSQNKEKKSPRAAAAQAASTCMVHRNHASRKATASCPAAPLPAVPRAGGPQQL